MLGAKVRMTRESQKKEELSFAKKAGELLGETWSINQSPNEEDWPDLIVSGVNGKFGLEIRNLFKDEDRVGSELRELESIRSSNLKKLYEAYYEISNIPISLKVLGDIDKKEVSAIAKFLKEKAELLSDQNRLDFEVDEFEAKFYISRIPLSFGKYKRWQSVSDNVGWVSKLEIPLIKNAITVKESKIDKYRSNINDVRLLLVINRVKNSGRAEIPDNILNIDTSFNEVYLMMYPERIVRVRRT